VNLKCNKNVFSYECNLNFSISDWFRDPLGIGIEVPGGTPYQITAAWAETYEGESQ
jgi:hypothetical protein